MKKIDDSFSVLMDDIRQLINRSRQYVAEKLTLEYGSGWSAKHLLHCLRSAETFSKESRVLYKIPDSVWKGI